jgi:hypothetical protein
MLEADAGDPIPAHIVVLQLESVEGIIVGEAGCRPAGKRRSH